MKILRIITSKTNSPYYVMNLLSEPNYISLLSLIPLCRHSLCWYSATVCSSWKALCTLHCREAPIIFTALPSGARGPAHYVQGLPCSVIVWVCNSRTHLATTTSKRLRPSLPFHCFARLPAAPQPAIKKDP